MDKVVSLLTSFPSDLPAKKDSGKKYHQTAEAFVDAIKGLSEAQLLQQTRDKQGILEFLDPSADTIAYALALFPLVKRFRTTLTHINDAEKPALLSLVQKIVLFVERSDVMQIRYVGTEARHIVESLPPFALALRQPALAADHIAHFILRLDPAASTFSSAHLLLSQLAVEHGASNAALEVLGRDILYIPKKNPTALKYFCAPTLTPREYITLETGLTRPFSAREIQDYFLNAATVFIGLHKWAKATELLESVISYPTKSDTTSLQMKDAFRKWILVTVLLNGKASQLPHLMSDKIAKTLLANAEEHYAVAECFDSDDGTKLMSAVRKQEAFWREHADMGLLQYVLEAHQEHMVRALAKVYKTVSLDQIGAILFGNDNGSSHAGAVEELLQSLASKNILNGNVVSTPDGGRFLQFEPEETEIADGPIVQKRIQQTLARVESIKGHIQDADRHLTQEKEYLHFKNRQKRANHGMPSGGLSAMETGLMMAAFDEDLMT